MLSLGVKNDTISLSVSLALNIVEVFGSVLEANQDIPLLYLIFLLLKRTVFKRKPTTMHQYLYIASHLVQQYSAYTVS